MSEVSPEISHEVIWQEVKSFEELNSELRQRLATDLAANHDRIEQLKQEYLPEQLHLHPDMKHLTDQKSAIARNAERYEQTFDDLRAEAPRILRFALGSGVNMEPFIPHRIAEVEPRIALAQNIETAVELIDGLAADEPIVRISHEPTTAFEVRFKGDRRKKGYGYTESRAAFRFNASTRSDSKSNVIEKRGCALEVRTVNLKEAAFSFFDGVSIEEVKQRHGRKYKRISLTSRDWRHPDVNPVTIEPAQAHLIIDAPHVTGRDINFGQHHTKAIRPLQSVEKQSQAHDLFIQRHAQQSIRVVAGEQIIDLPSNQGPAVWLLGEQAVKQHTLSAIESANWQQMSGERRSMLCDLAADIVVRSFGIRLK